MTAKVEQDPMLILSSSDTSGLTPPFLLNLECRMSLSFLGIGQGKTILSFMNNTARFNEIYIFQQPKVKLRQLIMKFNTNYSKSSQTGKTELHCSNNITL